MYLFLGNRRRYLELSRKRQNDRKYTHEMTTVSQLNLFLGGEVIGKKHQSNLPLSMEGIQKEQKLMKDKQDRRISVVKIWLIEMYSRSNEPPLTQSKTTDDVSNEKENIIPYAADGKEGRGHYKQLNKLSIRFK